MKPLQGEYYAECNQVFRQSSTQNGLMLEHIKTHCHEVESLEILSVGSGTGLFEIPMIKMLKAEGKEICGFEGIDISADACRLLDMKMKAEFGGTLSYRISHSSFQEYQPEIRFDLILLNHAFEYFGDRHLKWLDKSIALLSQTGSVVIFSPDKGGINHIYAEFGPEVLGFTPYFSEDLLRLLDQNGIIYKALPIRAMCDISLLESDAADPARTMLLSFLTQIDCRTIGPSSTKDFIDHFKSLAVDHQGLIPHPATFIALKSE
jgi:2-polyprenyl-3-methyl-5-hydroxy-6-metoxy-1,4-benzoquinol methylase